jgi:hypothetical protein
MLSASASVFQGKCRRPHSITWQINRSMNGVFFLGGGEFLRGRLEDVTLGLRNDGAPVHYRKMSSSVWMLRVQERRLNMEDPLYGLLGRRICLPWISLCGDIRRSTYTHYVPRESKFLWKEFRYLATVDTNVLGVFERLTCCAVSSSFRWTDSVFNMHSNKERSWVDPTTPCADYRWCVSFKL